MSKFIPSTSQIVGFILSIVCIILIIEIGTRNKSDFNLAKNILKNENYTEIELFEVTGCHVPNCQREDWYETRFNAKNNYNKKVHGYVCCSHGKSCSIKIDGNN